MKKGHRFMKNFIKFPFFERDYFPKNKTGCSVCVCTAANWREKHQDEESFHSNRVAILQGSNLFKVVGVGQLLVDNIGGAVAPTLCQK